MGVVDDEARHPQPNRGEFVITKLLIRHGEVYQQVLTKSLCLLAFLLGLGTPRPYPAHGATHSFWRTRVNEVNLANPHEYDHQHSSSAGTGWLRASVFGAMDGLVSNVALITGIAAAGASAGIIAITGISGLIAGAISMALGEYTSVRTQNEQHAVEVQTERDALQRNPEGEEAELAVMFTNLGMEPDTAAAAAAQVHTSGEQALKVHLAHELGLHPDEHPSPIVAAVSSLIAFSVGAIIPVLPFLLGFGTLWWGLGFGGFGLLLAGYLAAKFTSRHPLAGALRQLVFGGVAVAVTYAAGLLLGVSSFA